MYEGTYVPGAPRPVSDPSRLRGYRAAVGFLIANIALALIGHVLWKSPFIAGILVIQGALAAWLHRRTEIAGKATLLFAVASALWVTIGTIPPAFWFQAVLALPHWIHAAAFALALWGAPSQVRVRWAIATYVISIVASYLVSYFLGKMLFGW